MFRCSLVNLNGSQKMKTFLTTKKSLKNTFLKFKTMCLSFNEDFTYQTKQRLQGVISYVRRSTCILYYLLICKTYHLIDEACSYFILCC